MGSSGWIGTFSEFTFRKILGYCYLFQATPSAPVASRQGFCWPVCHIYQVIFQFSRKVEKSSAIISDFFQLFHKKVDLLVLNTSNAIPSKSLRLVLTNFMT